MDKPNYEFEYSNPGEVYTFISEGRNGSIKKMVKFQLIYSNLFNLSFGDCSIDGEDFDDKVVSNNGDMELVLSTVVAITLHFVCTNPGVCVHLTGSTPARTRVYRAIISNNYEAISKEFDVFGLSHRDWRLFKKNVNYEAFLIQNRFNFIRS